MPTSMGMLAFIGRRWPAKSVRCCGRLQPIDIGSGFHVYMFVWVWAVRAYQVFGAQDLLQA